MTRFLAVSSAILLSTLSVGLFAVSSAHAASSYDNTIHITDKLILKSPDGNKTKDVTTSYMQEIESCNIPRWKNSLLSVIGNQGKWSISLDRWNTQQVVVISWADNMPDLGGANNGGQFFGTSPDTYFATPGNYSVTIMMQNNESISCATFDPDVQGIALWKLSTEQQDQNWTNKLFLTTYPVVYPEGYSGKSIPQTAGKTVIAPDFTYEYTGNEIKATDHNKTLPDFTPDEGYRSEGWEVSWILYECKNGTYDDNTRVCHGDPAIIQDSLKFQKQNQEYSFTVPDHKQYKLEAQYAIKQCYRYPSYPSTPDYCAYFPLNGDNGYFKDYEFQTRDVILDINGGSGSGDTLNLLCDASGSCKPAPVNCSLEPGFFQKLSCQIQQQMKIGFINPIITIFVSMYQKMTVTSGQCSQLLPDSPPINGQTLPFSQLSVKVCQWSNTIRGNAAFAWVTIMVNLLFSLMIFIGIKNLINRITDHKDNEVIQS